MSPFIVTGIDKNFPTMITFGNNLKDACYCYDKWIDKVKVKSNDIGLTVQWMNHHSVIESMSKCLAFNNMNYVGEAKFVA